MAVILSGIVFLNHSRETICYFCSTILDGNQYRIPSTEFLTNGAFLWQWFRGALNHFSETLWVHFLTIEYETIVFWGTDQLLFSSGHASYMLWKAVQENLESNSETFWLNDQASSFTCIISESGLTVMILRFIYKMKAVDQMI